MAPVLVPPPEPPPPPPAAPLLSVVDDDDEDELGGLVSVVAGIQVSQQSTTHDRVA